MVISRKSAFDALQCRHRLLFLLPDDGVGLFMSANLLDRRMSHDLMEAFVDHYYPVATEPIPPQPPPDFQERVGRFTGAYWVNKHAHLTLEKMSQLGRNGADILLSPAHDWPEIDPMHAQMAVFRAIENGVSVVRQADQGRSITTDPYGRVLAEMDHFTASGRGTLLLAPPLP